MRRLFEAAAAAGLAGWLARWSALWLRPVAKPALALDADMTLACLAPIGCRRHHRRVSVRRVTAVYGDGANTCLAWSQFGCLLTDSGQVPLRSASFKASKIVV